MYKLLLFVMFAAVFMLMQAMQTEEETAVRTLFLVKHAVNRAAHAAAQQLDRDRLAVGDITIDAAAARLTALAYLRDNLRLDENGSPLPGSPLREAPVLAVCEVIGSERVFPYTYTNATYGYTVTLERPGVILIVSADYPHMFGSVLAPIGWEVKGTAELVM